MTKKSVLLVLFAVGLAAIYVFWFSDWFHPRTMKISNTYRNLHPRRPHGDSLPDLIFHVNPRIGLTELKVVPLAGFQTNKDVLPVWHLVSDSNSAPISTFYYGEFIHGMRPAIHGLHAEPLETNVTYRMFLAAGRVKGEHDFELHDAAIPEPN